MINITDTLNHGVHLCDLPIAVNEHDIVATYRCSLSGRAKLPLQHHQIAVDPDIPTRSKSEFRVVVKQLGDEIVDGVEAFDQLVRIEEGDILIVGCLHLDEAFVRVTFVEDA